MSKVMDLIETSNISNSKNKLLNKIFILFLKNKILLIKQLINKHDVYIEFRFYKLKLLR